MFIVYSVPKAGQIFMETAKGSSLTGKPSPDTCQAPDATERGARL